MARIKPSEMSAEWEKYLLELGERIRLFRALKQMTQKDLGAATGTSAPYIYQVETGKQNVSLELMWRIAQGLGLDLELLLSGGNIWEEPTEKSVQQLKDAVDKVKEELAELKRREDELLGKVERLAASSESLIAKFGGGTRGG